MAQQQRSREQGLVNDVLAELNIPAASVNQALTRLRMVARGRSNGRRELEARHRRELVDFDQETKRIEVVITSLLAIKPPARSTKPRATAKKPAPARRKGPGTKPTPVNGRRKGARKTVTPKKSASRRIRLVDVPPDVRQKMVELYGDGTGPTAKEIADQFKAQGYTPNKVIQVLKAGGVTVRRRGAKPKAAQPEQKTKRPAKAPRQPVTSPQQRAEVRPMSEAEREEAFQMQRDGKGVREIARHFDRAPSTISRTLRGMHTTRRGKK